MTGYCLAARSAAKWSATQSGRGTDGVEYFLTGFHNGIKTAYYLAVRAGGGYFLTGFHNGIKTPFGSMMERRVNGDTSIDAVIGNNCAGVQ